jgi:hypothetical protein
MAIHSAIGTRGPLIKVPGLRSLRSILKCGKRDISETLSVSVLG